MNLREKLRIFFYNFQTIPWFVSDTTKHDLEWLLEQLSAESEPVLARFGKHWKNYLTKVIYIYLKN